ncbi:hypothetical protein [Blastomonas sp.]|uniref:hypothetical protein n=2 Tax=Blastomonas TaxID=150203 RepID=UPI0025908A71|nr:hypothetical protein [Blastomonas sp.]
MMHRFALALACCLCAALTTPALAQTVAAPDPGVRTFRVDDSGTVVLDPFLEMQWQPSGPAGASNIVSASTRVSVQLNLATWVGQVGRIYMTLPRSSGPTVRASWRTGGGLLAGSLISGERALVYSGPIGSPILRDIIDLRLEVDSARLAGPESLSFGFEIELAP